jgi:hypothetical protein
MKKTTKEWRKHLFDRWLGEITLDKDELEFPYELADKLLQKLQNDKSHWSHKGLENKRQGFIAEEAFNKLCSEAGLRNFWSNVGGRSWGKGSWRPYDFHIDKSQIRNGDIEIKSLKPNEEPLSIKGEAWKHSESHYVVVFEIVNPEILSLDIQDIRSKNLCAGVKLLGYLTKTQIDKRKATPDTFKPSRKFMRIEFKSPKRLLQKLVKEKNAKWAMQ